MNDIDPDELSRAVVLWTGYESAAFPTRDDAALADMFSPQLAANLLSIVQAIEKEFYRSEAHITAASLSEMGEIASKDFKRQYPELPAVIAEAFAWCYTFDYK